MTNEEAYEILGVSQDIQENIKKAYLRLSKERHPDKGGDPQEFLKIHQAYKTLTEVQPPPQSRRENVEFHIQVSLEEAIFGVTLETNIRPQTISSTPMIGDRKSSANLDLVTLVQKIPPMILLQTNISFVHKGHVIQGVERDIKITYSIKEHERYKINPNKSQGSLLVNEIIPVTVALHGGIIEVKTLYGLRKLYIKPGANVGHNYEIKNHGPLGSLIVNISGFEMPVMEQQPQINPELEKEIEQEEDQLKQNEEIAKRI